MGGGVKVKYNMAWRVPDAVQSPETHGHDDSRQELFGKHINAAHKCGMQFVMYTIVSDILLFSYSGLLYKWAAIYIIHPI